MSRPDEYYLEARDRALAAIRALPAGKRRFTAPDGTRLTVNRRPMLGLLLAVVIRRGKGETGAVSFAFERSGRVTLAGSGDTRASRGELLDLAAEIERAEPDR